MPLKSVYTFIQGGRGHCTVRNIGPLSLMNILSSAGLKKNIIGFTNICNLPYIYEQVTVGHDFNVREGGEIGMFITIVSKDLYFVFLFYCITTLAFFN